MNAEGDEGRLTQLPVSKAVGGMIVDHANGLHERITNRRADEFEPPPFQVLTHGIGEWRVAGNVLGRFPTIVDWSPFDELPNILIKASKFLLDEKKSLCIGNGRLNFEPVSNDAGVAQQAAYFLCVIPGD